MTKSGPRKNLTEWRFGVSFEVAELAFSELDHWEFSRVWSVRAAGVDARMRLAGTVSNVARPGSK
jgi:hypothetical protein